MRRLMLALVAAASLGLSAQDSPRFAFFSFSRLANKSVRAARVTAELEVLKKDFNDRGKAKMDARVKIIGQLQSGSLSDEGREALQKQLRAIEQELKNLQEDAQMTVEKVESKVLGELNKLARPVADSLATERKLQLLLDERAMALIYSAVDEAWLWDFTDEVARRLDAAEPTATGVAKPASKPADKKPAAPAKKG